MRYKDWKTLHENLGNIPLGVKTTQSLGLVRPGQFKEDGGMGMGMNRPHPDDDDMDDDDMNKDHDEDEDDDDMDDDDMDKDHDDHDDDDMDDKDGDVDPDKEFDDDSLDGEDDEEDGEFANKMSKPHNNDAFMKAESKKNKCDKCGKKDCKCKEVMEDAFSMYGRPKEVDDSEKAWLGSLASMYGNPLEKFDSGFREDMLLSPEPGQPGWSPETRIGDAPQQATESAINKLMERIEELEKKLKRK